MGLTFAPTTVDSAYHQWPSLPDLLPVSFPGVQTCRDDALVAIDRERLVKRMEQYFDPDATDEDVSESTPGLLSNSGTFIGRKVRSALIERGFRPDSVVRCAYRPFDDRWLYWELEGGLLDRSRPDYHPHIASDNLWLAAAQRNRRDFDSALATRIPADRHVIERGANLFPAYLNPRRPSFAAQVAAQNGWKAKPFEPDAIADLQRYPWPGNARELRNVVERLLLLADGPVDRAAVRLALPQSASARGAGRRGIGAAPRFTARWPPRGRLRARADPGRAQAPQPAHDGYGQVAGAGAESSV